VHLLDGGLSAWMEAGGPIEKSCSDDDDENDGQVASVSFSDAAAAAVVVPVSSSSSSSSSNCGSGGGAAASLDASLVATWQDVLSVAAPAAVDTATTDLSSSGEIATTDIAAVILDARPPGRFEGTAAEPRPVIIK
jgi:3-mercaptopyruvate sulfurtransferase SseA